MLGYKFIIKRAKTSQKEALIYSVGGLCILLATLYMKMKMKLRLQAIRSSCAQNVPKTKCSLEDNICLFSFIACLMEGLTATNPNITMLMYSWISLISVGSLRVHQQGEAEEKLVVEQKVGVSEVRMSVTTGVSFLAGRRSTTQFADRLTIPDRLVVYLQSGLQ